VSSVNRTRARGWPHSAQRPRSKGRAVDRCL